ncbi:hypothetical protein [Streptomyces albospinus]|nr:hypothetical protein [Streptomyces albospinus]
MRTAVPGSDAITRAHQGAPAAPSAAGGAEVAAQARFQADLRTPAPA